MYSQIRLMVVNLILLNDLLNWLQWLSTRWAGILRKQVKRKKRKKRNGGFVYGVSFQIKHTAFESKTNYFVIKKRLQKSILKAQK